MLNKETFLKAYEDVFTRGNEVRPRGKLSRELRNYSFDINPLYPITSFEHRRLNLQYCKYELLWYLYGDRFDTSITKVASTWQKLIQPDGGINSNYGQVIFTGPRHFDWVVEELIRDKDSRRAVIIIGDPNNLNKENTDHRCTMYINYQIRDNKLHQTVRMRSNDVIFGLTNDLFCFGFLHQFVYHSLLPFYQDLKLGIYTHCADSMHVYERHFNMIEMILSDPTCVQYDIPSIFGVEEIQWLRFVQDRNDLRPVFEFSKWLLS